MRRSSKFAFGFLMILFLMGVFVVFGMVRLATRGEVSQVQDHSLLVLDLSGDFRDRAPGESLIFPGMDETSNTLLSVQSALKEAKDDEKIRGILMDVGGLQLGWGAAQEIRDAILDFKESGKSVTAYMEVGQAKDYYVAVVADKLYLAPAGMLFLNGLSAEAQFYQNTLEMIGVEADYHNIGKYKSAVESYTRSDMSEAHREALSTLLDSLYSQLISGIAQGRHLSEAEVEAFIDDFSISGGRLVETRIVDGLFYRDQVLETLRESEFEEPALITLGDYRRLRGGGLTGGSGPKIAILYVGGEIHSGESGTGLFGGESVGSDTISEAAKAIMEDEDIQAVVVRLDSPGGSALAADIMWRDISRLKEKGPVIMSMSNLAASGGYWIATAGDAIVAQPGTITGSIGVFMGKMNLGGRDGLDGGEVKEGLTDKLGIGVDVVSRGRYAQMFSAFRMFSTAEVDKIDEMLHETYDTFLNKASTARGMTTAEVHEVAQGRIWTGEQALKRSLVDKLGGLPVAVAMAKEMANLEAGKQYPLAIFPREKSLLERILSQLGMIVQVKVDPRLQHLASLLSEEQTLLDPGPQALLPFIPNIY